MQKVKKEHNVTFILYESYKKSSARALFFPLISSGGGVGTTGLIESFLISFVVSFAKKYFWLIDRFSSWKQVQK